MINPIEQLLILDHLQQNEIETCPAKDSALIPVRYICEEERSSCSKCSRLASDTSRGMAKIPTFEDPETCIQNEEICSVSHSCAWWIHTLLTCDLLGCCLTITKPIFDHPIICIACGAICLYKMFVLITSVFTWSHTSNSTHNGMHNYVICVWKNQYVHNICTCCTAIQSILVISELRSWRLLYD